MSAYFQKITVFLAKAVGNFYPENFDHEIRKMGLIQRVTILLGWLVATLGRMLGKDLSVLVVSRRNYYLENIERFYVTYDRLSDEESREKYIELLAYRMLGFTKVKLSLNNDKFWAARAGVAASCRPERLPVNFRKGYLELYDLSSSGYDLKLYFVENGIFVDFMLQQYNYNDIVCVGQGDVVIDAGGCWGDTALYFASRGASKVFVYEFIPSNIDILKKNISLNKQYEACISLVERAVWEQSGIDLSYKDQGPASCVAQAGVYSGVTQTLSIDDLVIERGLATVDFIKMDIEGAELSAIKGAANTIRKYKPKLAISVYHKPDDLITIPEFISSLNPDYEFYLDYYTIVGDEIILYAIDKHAK